MTLEEFVRLSPKQIRSDERLMQLYVKFHEAAFFLLNRNVRDAHLRAVLKNCADILQKARKKSLNLKLWKQKLLN